MAQRAGVSFELERLDVEGDELIVTGHWTGVRGLRFVRPTLVADDRRILATLEHKPWAPSLDRTWIAAFPWDRDEVDVDELALAVGSQVTVPLGDAAPVSAPPGALPPVVAPPEVLLDDAPPDEEPPAQHEQAAPPGPSAPPAQHEQAAPPGPSAPPQSQEPDRLAALQAELDRVSGERDVLAGRVEDAERLNGEREQRLRDEAASTFDELARAQAVSERDRDRARAQLDEAVAAREAAVRTRARMEIAHDEALQARAAVEAQLAATRAELDEANAQRDEVLLAYRALQRHVQTERAREDRTDQGEVDHDRNPEEPSGVRTMPAARTVMAELQRPTKPFGKLPFSTFDLWVIRVLGTVAAACFILLLVSILRVFI
jgi:hypothetical protein